MTEDGTARAVTRREFVRASALGLVAAAIRGAKALAPKMAPEDEDDDRLDVQRKEFEDAARRPRFL